MELKQFSRFFTFWMIWAALALLFISFLPWRFQVNDDELMMWLVSGAYTGTTESFAVFLHPFLSWSFSKLYFFAPSIPWYPITWFVGMYLSFLTWLRTLEKMALPKNQRLLLTLLLFGFYIHFLFFLQFSIVSAFAIAAGWVARWENSRDEKKKSSLFPSDLLIIFGFLVRPIVLFLFLFASLGIWWCWYRKSSLAKNLALPLLIGIVGGITFWLWVSTQNMQDIKEVNRLRSQVFDHPVLQLQKDQFRDSNPDLYHFSNGLIDFHTHPELTDKLPDWKDLLDQKRADVVNLPGIKAALTTFIAHEHLLLGLFGLLLVFSFLIQPKWTILGLGGLLGVLVLASPFVLIKVQVYGIIFLVAMICTPLIPSPKSPADTLINSLIFISISVLAYHVYSFTRSTENLIPGDDLRIDLAGLPPNAQTYLIGKGDYYRDLLFDKPLPFQLLGWPTLLPTTQRKDEGARNFYFVDSATYFNNRKYFLHLERKESRSSMILLASPSCLD